MPELFDKNKLIVFWIDSSDKDFKTMQDLYQTNNNSWALFMGHLVIEKLLKALYILRTNDIPPLIHDLRRLSEKSGLELEPERKMMLDTITRFNIKARYDEYKQNFYSLCTDEFTKYWIGNIIEIRLWVKSML